MKVLVFRSGILQTQAKECWQSPATEEAKNAHLPRASGGSKVLPTLTLDFRPLVRE